MGIFFNQKMILFELLFPNFKINNSIFKIFYPIFTKQPFFYHLLLLPQITQTANDY